MPSQKKDHNVLIYFICVIATLIIHYFFISKIQINSTFQVAIDFVIAIFLSGFVANVVEEMGKSS